MDKTYDDLSAISTLVQTLTPQVSETADHISRLEKIIKELAPKEEYEQLIKPPSTTTPDIIDDQTIIKKLEEYRLGIVMELQKQDFIGEKLTELIVQNQDIIDSVKEYLASRETIQLQESNHNQRLYNNFVDNTVKPTIESLDSGLLDMERATHSAQKKLQKVFQEKQETDRILQSKEYQEKLNLLVKGLNDISTKREQS